MDQFKPNLGLCFFENQLFYAVNDIHDSRKLARIGSVDFNFDVTRAVLTEDSEQFTGIKKTVADLREQYGVNHIRMLSIPARECWTILPKLVYDNPDEREAHIRIIMKGINRQQIHPTWHTLSNHDYKFLLLRNSKFMQGFENLVPESATTDLVSEFEIGDRWIHHCKPGGSFMTVCCFANCITVSSYILGKMRGATYITFDDPEDLPYLWLHRVQELSWLQGLHEDIHVYGSHAYRIIDILQPLWDEAGKIQKMDSLEKIKVEAEEETYGFNLELAYPAIMLSLN